MQNVNGQIFSMFCVLGLKMPENNRLTIFLKSKIQKQIGKIGRHFSATKPLIPNDADPLDEQPKNSKE